MVIVCDELNNKVFDFVDNYKIKHEYKIKEMESNQVNFFYISA